MSHRSTTYPCFDQDLGDSAGAGSTDLPMQNYANVMTLQATFAQPKTLTVARMPRFVSLLIIHCTLYIFFACSSANEHLEAGRTLLRANKPREALAELNLAVEADANSAEAFTVRGVAYFELKEYANAQLDYEQAIKLAPDSYRPYYNRALLRTAQNDLAGAVKDYSDAIRLAPDTADTYLNRGQLFVQQGQTQPALNDFDQAIKLNPKNVLALYNRGNIRYQQRDLAGATSDFRQAIQYNPTFGKGFYGLGLAQLLQNQKEMACLSLKQAQKLGYADAANAVAAYCE
jgi:tetratricopeptide (TPR) repeat protein